MTTVQWKRFILRRMMSGGWRLPQITRSRAGQTVVEMLVVSGLLDRREYRPGRFCYCLTEKGRVWKNRDVCYPLGKTRRELDDTDALR